MPTPKRFDGYVRVSRRMGRKVPGYISPTVQKEAIARWAESTGEWRSRLGMSVRMSRAVPRISLF